MIEVWSDLISDFDLFVPFYHRPR